MIYVNAGELDQFVTLQERDDAGVDSLGQPNGAWVDVFTDIRARADTRPGRDMFAAGQDQATLSTTFRIRYREGVHERMRLLWRGQVYEIVGQPLNVQGANVAIDLVCVAGQKDGR